MTVALIAPEASVSPEHEDSLTHIICCLNDDRSRCGQDLTGDYVDEGEGFFCVVCENLAALGCPNSDKPVWECRPC